MKLKLSIEDQKQLLAAFSQLEGGKLGAERRAAAKNIATLRASLITFEQADRALIAEFWPQLKESGEVLKVADPEKPDAIVDPQNLAQYHAIRAQMSAATDELELLPLPAGVVYGAGNEFSVQALALLELRGLILDDAAAA